MKALTAEHLSQTAEERSIDAKRKSAIIEFPIKHDNRFDAGALYL
ncbi:hypothetical protein [Paraburkholderia humisilvae]|uniref:Uncharacterized protein n=1 Tax=Paraburkholderia humisilvae TaxID=627669 RepID=A0A6J5EY08_9BURK|nr:hypothetical protein LMG29542_06249 [Paraburkholderia humisilvae]